MGRPRKYPLDGENKMTEQETVEKIITKATAKKDFYIQMPMPAQWNTLCILNFKKNDEITDPYVLSFLKLSDRPVEYS